MLRFFALILLGLWFAAPVHAGLFADETARKQIGKLEGRAASLEGASKQQTKAMLNLQAEIEALNAEIRKLRGQNEELVHSLQDAEKRQKDFYVDLDTRLRRLEAAEAAAAAARENAPAAPAGTASSSENRDFENAYAFFKRGSNADAVKAFRDFLKKYPDSAQAANAYYGMGSAQFELKEYKGALLTFRDLLKRYPDSSRAADAYLSIAECKRVLKYKGEPQKTLKQLVAKYPNSEAAAKAKKLLAASK